MATAALFQVMHEDGSKAIHPFFDNANEVSSDSHCSSRTTLTVDGPPRPAPTELQKNSRDAWSESSDQQNAVQLDGTAETASKGRKKKGAISSDGKKQKSLRELLIPSGITTPARESSDDTAHEVLRKVVEGVDFTRTPVNVVLQDSPHAPEFQDIDRRSKRRRTSKHDDVEVGRTDTAFQPGFAQDAEPALSGKRDPSPQVIVPAFSASVQDSNNSDNILPQSHPGNPRTPPKKMLRLNGTGKFSSPISKKTNDGGVHSVEPIKATKRRGRPRKIKDSDVDRHLLVHLRYGNNAEKRAELGRKIEAILQGESRTAHAPSSSPNSKRRTPKKPTKKLHPLFVKEKPAASKPASPKKLSATTPGKLKMQTIRETADVRELPFVSSLSKDRLMVKHPGAKDPRWPNRVERHVRAIRDDVDTPIATLRRDMTGAKQKQRAGKSSISPKESILSTFMESLYPEEEPVLRVDGYSDPNPSLMLPLRRLIPGHEIARRVEPLLSAAVAEYGLDELESCPPSQSSCHPAVMKLFERIPTSLSAFDICQGESQVWATKYAPQKSLEILQPARQTSILKDWLTSLTVKAVETGNGSDAKLTGKADNAKSKKKRRRKVDDLDDFLVDDDEVLHEMGEVDDFESTTMPADGQLKSIVQVAGHGTRLGNAVLLSGPHGCGKTAAAYAVANELGFKVFDISPCDRRSGKDVLDKVGDMTENHLVKHHGTDTELSAAEESTRHDEAFQRDLQSGRQGTMSAFFNPKQQTQPRMTNVRPKQAIQAKAKESVQKALKKIPKDQQQSLILLEEVDILFRDDKDFWGTVLKLILSSKRPFIMTCNDEDLVPLQAMSLHAILRFTPPAVNVAVDYLLLIAANEGHLLKHDAVEELYRTKEHDLRASINELDFWCQIGVGDPKSGLSWMFQRWPPGSDKDEEGRTVRVVSEGSYQSAMSLTPGNDLSDGDTLKWISTQLQTDPILLIDQYRVSAGEVWCETLKDASRFADTLSFLDICSALSARKFQTDTTQKPMPEKSRSHYTDGMRLLQTDEQADFHNLTGELVASASFFGARLCASKSDLNLNQHLRRNRSHEVPYQSRSLQRHDFACLDPISWTAESVLSNNAGMQITSLDGPLSQIATDIAPYVRNIVQYDLALEEQRNILNGIGDGARVSKRARTTRAARSALEGSQRASTRRERWFAKELDLKAVLGLGGAGWPMFSWGPPDAEASDAGETPASSASSII